MVSHRVDNSKANDLEQNYFQICEMKIYPNQYIPEDILTEEKFLYYVSLIKEKMLREKNVGKFVNNVNPPKGSEWEEGYLQMKQYEDDIKKLENIIEANNDIITDQKKEFEERLTKIKLLMSKEKDMKEDVAKRQRELYAVENEIGSRKEINEQNQELIKKNSSLKDKVKELELCLAEERHKGFLKKLFKC